MTDMEMTGTTDGNLRLLLTDAEAALAQARDVKPKRLSDTQSSVRESLLASIKDLIRGLKADIKNGGDSELRINGWKIANKKNLQTLEKNAVALAWVVAAVQSIYDIEAFSADE